ncbi:prolipoprotein diacylglyceryl transferase [Mycoplasma agalactiae]|uniref:prolipoprotein diacylglyceryl transferase n=1 Tax=Mycoplasmopsis agalactiae TaxID=2110 RepID=UPI001455E278|nr:prolipoprotein diacylglyceryl transferase [Mycoplasmopsis agalactiae]NLS34697.1 prolipoprotein diacylglyceryl transferase [Mycoplasmopsis agalactiae]
MNNAEKIGDWHVYPGVWTPEAGKIANEASVLFRIGSLLIHTYSLTMMLGMIAAILTIVIFWRRAKYEWEILLTLIFLTIPMAILGSRIWNEVDQAINNPNYNWRNWYKVWEGGLSIQGGVVLAVVVDLTYVYFKRDKIDIRKACDIIIPTILIGQVIGRWGNYANHEVYGRIDYSGASSLIFGRAFAENMFLKDESGTGYRYPLFLYESIVNLFAYIILVWVINQMSLLKPGATAPLYFVWYGLVRIAMEPLRDYRQAIYVGAAYAFAVLGGIAFIFFQFFNPTHYVREWKRGRFIYQYAHPEEYIAWIEKTRIKTKNSKPITKVVS